MRASVFLRVKNEKPQRGLHTFVIGCNTLQSPVFTKQPGSIVFPVDSMEKNREVVFSCEAQGDPPPFYRWKLNGSLLNPKPGSHHSLSGGNLRINHLNKDEDAGTYQCLASNSFGTIVSREASLTFAYLENFKTHKRSSVSVREGQGVVLLCGPPPHSGGVMGEYEPKIEVQFPEIVQVAKGSTVRLECFALGNPVPSISWHRVDGVPFTRKVDVRKTSGVMEIPYFQQEDAGTYECVAENTKGRNSVQGKLTFFASPQLIEKPQDVQKAIDDSLVWECKATGKPKPSYRWMKNGENLEPTEERVQVINGALSITRLALSDIGMYQCVAGNKYGEVYSNAELRVIAVAPDFSQNQLKSHTLVKEGGDVLIECKPKMSPRGMISWRKGNDALRENSRIAILESGSLRISNVTKLDAGTYTCVARNQFGEASSSGNMLVK
ncbi:hypothetical protein cypCar_00008886, partial [Cyprinus carpio]